MLTTFKPFFGQLANSFGRRYVTLAIVAFFFTLGSGIYDDAATLIAGRAVQGIGRRWRRHHNRYHRFGSSASTIAGELRGHCASCVHRQHRPNLDPWVGDIIVCKYTIALSILNQPFP
ncbi:hypothetical protein F4809DRAFT_463790 [Biscogniauxia mediterranea]|nr:hypothetical protein F4809DRAFT_463790 [Biscogniauxia mediterranea]